LGRPARDRVLAGEVTTSRHFSEGAFTNASEPKELYFVPGTGHIDLLDRVNILP
jgi:uncharacterized protein